MFPQSASLPPGSKVKPLGPREWVEWRQQELGVYALPARAGALSSSPLSPYGKVDPVLLLCSFFQEMLEIQTFIFNFLIFKCRPLIQTWNPVQTKYSMLQAACSLGTPSGSPDWDRSWRPFDNSVWCWNCPVYSISKKNIKAIWILKSQVHIRMVTWPCMRSPMLPVGKDVKMWNSKAIGLSSVVGKRKIVLQVQEGGEELGTEPQSSTYSVT